MSVTAPEQPPAGRRERKKQRTREALIDAALTLFMEKGFEATTVEEIADAVDVSSRTFFRYFSSKEEVALAPEWDKFDAILDAIADRPPEEPVITAIRHGVVAFVRQYEGDEGGDDLTMQRFVRVQELIAANPLLLNRSLERISARLADMAALIAQRMGTDPVTDIRPHLIAGICFCGVRTSVDSWLRQTTVSCPTADAVDQAMELLEQGINYPSALR